MIKVRSAFYCTICDYHNHRYFNLIQKAVNIDEESCSVVAEKTVNFAFTL